MGTALKGEAVLFSEMTPAPGDEASFNDWYDNHHTPSHVQGVPGFLSAHRYAALDGPGYCAVYELDDPATLETPEYRSRKYTPDARTKAMLASVSGFTRYIGNEMATLGDPEAALDAEILLAVFFAVPEDRQAEFVEWVRHRARTDAARLSGLADGPPIGGPRSQPRSVHPHDPALSRKRRCAALTRSGARP